MRYYFDIIESAGACLHDEQGELHDDRSKAEAEAAKVATEMVRYGFTRANAIDCAIEVRGENGPPFVRVRVCATLEIERLAPRPD